MKTTKRLLALLLCIIMTVSVAACGEKKPVDTSSTTTSEPAAVKPDVPENRRDASSRTGNNEKTPLVLSSGDMDGKFNPFYATSQYDTDVVNMTQMTLITNNEKAEPVSGIDLNTYALSHKMTVSEDGKTSTYEFILKNGIKFSDGTPVTGKDVLFNLYEYLDPKYTGSATLFSMNIQGLKSYRTQVLEEKDAIAKDDEFMAKAVERVKAVVEGTGTEADTAAAWAKVKEYIAADAATLIGGFTFEDATGEKSWPSDTNINAIILAYTGNITCKDGKITAVDTNVDLTKLATYTKEECIDLAYNYVKANMTLVDYDLGFGWTVVTDGKAKDAYAASDMAAQFKAEEAAKYVDANKGTVKSISGIKLDTVTDDKGVTRERVTVVLDGVDPQAIWNFTFQVAPMSYYSTPELAAKANGVDAFGVELSNQDFQDQLKKKVVPVGAGPYKACSSTGSVTTKLEEFYKDGITYFVANDDFMLSAPKIKYLRFKTITLGSELTVLKGGEVHYSDPSASTENINQLNGTNLKNLLVDNLGYGYIGMNSQLIPEINARRAIASALDVELVLEYYTGGLAENIYRSMSKVSWAYPEDATNMYPFDETGAKSKEYFLNSDKFKEVNGKVVNADGSPVTYKFILPSDAKDHPAGAIFLKAKEVLAKIGVEVTVETDSAVLSKLQTNTVAVWAAAWSATIDPDMYQVFYSNPDENTSGSPLSYGLYNMYKNGSEEEKALLVKINELILKGRTSLNVDERKPVYKEALEKVAQLCVEIPTYQRKNMFVYNSDVIDGTSLWDKVTPYKGPIAEIWNVSLKG